MGIGNKLLNGAKSLATIAANKVAGVNQTAPQDVIERRTGKCMTCPKLIKATKQCGVCYCFISSKVEISWEACPEDRWGPVDPIQE